MNPRVCHSYARKYPLRNLHGAQSVLKSQLLLAPESLPFSVRVCRQSLHEFTLPTARALVGVLGLLDLRNQELKSLANVLVVASAGLGPRAVELLRQLAPVFLADLSLLGPQIALITHNDDRDPVCTLRRARGCPLC